LGTTCLKENIIDKLPMGYFDLLEDIGRKLGS